MREILFRGKRTDTGEWIEGYYEFGYDSETETPTHYMWVLNHTEKYGEIFTVIPETVGQYTGLTDKNGKKIFEGDIVKVERDLWHGENKKEREIFNGVVWYDEKHTCFGLKSLKYKCLPLHRFKGDYEIVIGNIHDNPELLEGGE